MVLHGITFPENQLAAFCQRHAVKTLRVFGSILTEKFDAQSDIDLLVEFEQGRTPGIVGFGAMILELEAMLNRRVDLRTPEDLSRFFRPGVMREARLLHAA